MPRGKKNKRKNNQDVLTTRLMQISLKMDDHIYSNKHISASVAEEYIQEIASLKLKCPRTNLRALQVIEKLTRCMKGIIIEDQVNAEDEPESSVQAYTEIVEPCSPVYSLPDEDRTEFLTLDDYINDNQTIDLTEDNEKTIQEQDNLIEKVKIAISKMGLQDEPQISIADDDCSQSILENFQNDNTGCSEINRLTIDLTENNENTIQEPENLIEKVKIAISKMGLQDEPQISIADDDYSQSILENFQNDNTGCSEINRQTDYSSVNVPNNQPKQVINEVIEAAGNLPQSTILQQDPSQSVLDIFYNENTKCCEASLERELEIYQYINKSNQVTQPTVANEIYSVITMNDTLATQQSIFSVKAPNFDLNEEISTKPPAQASKKENKKGRQKKNKEDNNAKDKRKSQSKIKDKTKTTKKENHLHIGKKAINIVLGKGVIRSNISVDKPQTSIYNKNVECDLSWVENLRYVREISPEENDPTLSCLDDNFWNNFSLPQNWNDRDFEI